MKKKSRKLKKMENDLIMIVASFVTIVCVIICVIFAVHPDWTYADIIKDQEQSSESVFADSEYLIETAETASETDDEIVLKESPEMLSAMPCETAEWISVSETTAETIDETTETIEETAETVDDTIETAEETTETASEIDSHIYYDIPISKEDQAITEDICEMYGIDHRIIFAQMRQESYFDPYCIGDAGLAIGILQIQPKWFHEEMQRLGITDLTRINESVLLACDFMSSLINRYGNYRDALTHYRYGDLTIDAEDYAEIVMNYANELKEIENE